MKKKTIVFFLMLSVGCFIGKQQVYINELHEKPNIFLKNTTLIIKLDNSIKNSGLVIYEINISVNYKTNEIYLYVFQSINKKIHNIFEIDLLDYKIKNPSQYEIFWFNPDGTKEKLEINNQLIESTKTEK